MNCYFNISAIRETSDVWHFKVNSSNISKNPITLKETNHNCTKRFEFEDNNGII